MLAEIPRGVDGETDILYMLVETLGGREVEGAVIAIKIYKSYFRAIVAIYILENGLNNYFTCVHWFNFNDLRIVTLTDFLI